MKSFSFLLLLLILISFGCHRKLNPATSTTTTTTIPNKTAPPAKEPVKPLLDSTEAAEGVVTPTAPTVVAKPIIIVDAHGNFAVTESELPPDASKSIMSNSNARAYTP